MKMYELDQNVKQDVAESEKKGLYYYVNKRKKAGTSRDASSPKAPSAQAWKDAAKTAKKEDVAEGRRGYDDLRDTGFGRSERDMSDESNLLYIYKDGRVRQRMVSNTVEREARAEGFRDTPEQALKMHGIIKSKFKPGKWVQKQGDNWSEVFPFGNSKDVTESASAGATSSANIATVVNPDQAHSKKPVKSVNALDQDEVSLFGAPMETVKNTAGKKAAIIKRR
jgi:hypothetical protein